MIDEKKLYLINLPPWKAILKFAVPIFFTSMLQQLYNVADTVIAGKFIGKHALASVSGCGAVMFLLASLFMGIGIGATSIISQYYGSKDTDNLRKSVDTFMLFIYVGSILFLIVGLVFAEPLLRLLNTPEDIFEHSLSYLRIIFLGGPALFGYSATSSILYGIGNSKTPLKILGFSGLLNILLNILFVTTTKLGVSGLALSTSISQFVSFILCVIYINRNQADISLHLRSAKLSLTHLKRIIKIGLPSGVQQIGVSLSFLAVQSLVNSFGSLVIAGVGSAEKVEQIAFLPIVSLGSALSTFTGQNIGASKIERVHTGLVSTVIMSTILSAIIYIFVIIFLSESILLIFTNDENVISYGLKYLRVIGPFYFVLGFSFVLLGVMRGSGATFVPMIIGLVGQVGLRVPLAYFLVSIIKSPEAIWLSIPSAWCFSSIGLFIYYKTGKWKKHIAVKSLI